MINVLNMTKTGVVDNIPEFKFEFEFDSASTLPVKTYVLGQKTYLIAKDSTAKNLSTNTYYKYGGVDDKWVKVLPTPTPTPVDNTKITDNGDYNLINNDFAGYNEVSVNVSAEPPTLIEKTITENGTYAASDDEADGYSSVTVNVSGGGGASSGTDVVFYDYDGSVVVSYSAADFANLAAMPDNPTHTGLTAQGWNWTLADAKTYVAANGKLNIGQMYVTSDGKTRLYYVIPKDGLTLEIELNLDEDTELDVDWGDNTEHTTWTSNDGDSSKSHTYANGGKYTVAINVISGGFSLSHPWDIDKTLRKVEIGSGVTSITSLNQCVALAAISIPNTVLSINDSAFSNCSALCYITIPSGVDMLCEGSFTSCSALTAISIPNSVNWFDTGTLFKCYSLKAVFIPPAVTHLGTGTFSYCYALASIIIPSNITTIGSAPFQDCHTLTSITFEPTTPPELDGELGIPTTCVIRVPQGSLSAYTSAANYPDPSQYIYEEY